MYKLNPNVVVRTDDKSIFSLNKMEIYEFNEVGYDAVSIIKEAGEDGLSFEEWKSKAKKIPEIVDEDIEEFLDGLIQQEMIIPVEQ